MPSERMRLEASGFSAATAFDFDRAVATLGRVIDAKMRETTPVKVTALPAPEKGKAWGEQPKYTLRQLLYDATEDESWRDDDAPVPDALAHLPTAGL